MTPRSALRVNTFQSERFLLPGSPLRWLNLVRGGNPARPPVLCLHGGTGNWANYRPLLSHLGNDFCFFLPELRGHGLSPWFGECSLDEMYADVEHVASTLPHPFILVAHSFGGYFGVRLAATRPEWVSHLMLMNTASHIPTGAAMRAVLLASPVTELLASPEGVLSTGSAMTRYLIERLVPQWDCEPYYASVCCPSLVVLGALDPLVPLGLGKASAARLRNAQTKVLPVGFHISMWEQPGRLAQWLREFVAVHPPGPGTSSSAASSQV